MIRRCVLVLLVLLTLPVGEALADLVVVVNARSGVAAMTRNEVINVFFGRNRQFFNGLEVHPVDLLDSPQRLGRQQFYKILVGKDLAEVDAFWSRQVFTGRMQAPARLTSSEEVIRWVATHPGGIGYVDQAQVDARVRIVYELKH